MVRGDLDGFGGAEDAADILSVRKLPFDNMDEWIAEVAEAEKKKKQ